MNKPYLKAILAVTSLAFKTDAIGQTIPKNKPGAAEKKIMHKYLSGSMETGHLPITPMLLGKKAKIHCGE